MSDPRRPVIAAYVTGDDQLSIDTLSASWRVVEAHIRAELTRALNELETSGMPLEATENLRGEIKALRGVLELADPNRTLAHVGPEAPYV